MEEAALKMKERRIGDVVILDFEGKMLIGEGDDQLRDAIWRLTNQGNVKIILNMSGVTYFDSAGLGEISRSLTTVRRKGGNLVLFHPQKKLLDLLSITKLIVCFTIFDDKAEEEEAIRSFAR